MIENKVHNIDLVIEEIKNFPQTYKTILQDEHGNGTLQVILRRKLNKQFKQGNVCKTSIPGTRFGKAIFYAEEKDYHILVEAGRLGSNVFCFFKYDKVSKFYIRLNPNEYWELKKGVWEQGDEEKILFEGKVLKFI